MTSREMEVKQIRSSMGADTLAAPSAAEAEQGRRARRVAVKPLSVTVIPRSCRSTRVLHSSGSTSADYPQYTKGISSPQRVFCWFDAFRVNRRKPEDLLVLLVNSLDLRSLRRVDYS